MSTKKLLAGGDGFQLYEDLFEEECVFLELSPAQFEASAQFVRVRIPIEVWETIRHHGEPDLSLLKKSEEEVRSMVEAAVDERIRAHSQGDLSARFDACTYGNVEASRDDQIAAGISAYRAEIRSLRRVSDAIDRLKNPTASGSSSVSNEHIDPLPEKTASTPERH